MFTSLLSSLQIASVAMATQEIYSFKRRKNNCSSLTQFYITFGIVAIFISFTSCKEGASEAPNDTGEIWKLFEMKSGNNQLQEDRGNELSWKEEYIFNSDSTFVKKRLEKSQTSSAKGTYTTKEFPSEGIYYTLTYETSNAIVGSCTGRDSENLLLRPDGKMQNSWMMCDGPFLVYEKKSKKSL